MALDFKLLLAKSKGEGGEHPHHPPEWGASSKKLNGSILSFPLSMKCKCSEAPKSAIVALGTLRPYLGI